MRTLSVKATKKTGPTFGALLVLAMSVVAIICGLSALV